MTQLMIQFGSFCLRKKVINTLLKGVEMNEQDYKDELKVLYDKAVKMDCLALAMQLLDKRRAVESCVKNEALKPLATQIEN